MNKKKRTGAAWVIFMIRINRIIWRETFVEKIISKHHVTISEVEEILYSKKKVYRVAKGDVSAEDVHMTLGKTSAGGIYPCSSS